MEWPGNEDHIYPLFASRDFTNNSYSLISSLSYSELQNMRTILLVHCLMAIFAINAALHIIHENHDINTDQSSLLAFRDRISFDPNGTISRNWSTASPVCNWIGITCDHSHHRVVALNLSDVGLVGTISSHLGNLSLLSSLDLSNNRFHGSIPSELAHLPRLKLIDLAFNNLTGEIPPWFEFLPNLEILALAYNSFSGAIPATLFNIASLQKLYLNDNKLEGFLPSNVFNASSLLKIVANSNRLSGSFPSFILSNSPVRVIAFATNNLSGEIPERIFHLLPNLEELHLSENQFSGNIPISLFDCRKLQILSLSLNNFEGVIPREIGNLTMLRQLFLGYNNFSQGSNTIPNEIGNLHNLQEVGLQNASLSGSIPQAMFNISSLIEVSLYKNHLSGNLPSLLGSKLPNLEALYLGDNYLSGKIPNSLANATNLKLLEFQTNSFSGYIPEIFGDLKNLEILHLAENNLTVGPSNPESGFINSLTKCIYLRELTLSQNPLNSIIPKSIGNLSSFLEYLDYWNCNMIGCIPLGIGNLSGLFSLDLSENQLTGRIPFGIKNLQKLEGFYLDGNNFEGFLPNELCQLKRLADLDLATNRFYGPIPACLGNNTSLGDLSLSNNTLNLSIPDTLWGLSDLVNLDLSSNELRGSLAPRMSNLKVIETLDLSRNRLTGGIPNSIVELQGLKNFSMAHNEFEGRIPESLGKMVSLEFLDLSWNNLSGVIPKSMETLVYLKSFNVSFNNLEGEVPTNGPFTNFSAQSFKGNKDLCGAPRLQLPKCKFAKISKQSTRSVTIVLKYVFPAVVATMLLLTFICVFLKCCKNYKKPSITEANATMATWRRISYYELQQATNGYVDANLIGIGSFGKVYKGLLSDGLNIAVKVLNLELEGAFKSFDVECKVLRNVRHRNLTKIISSCSNIDFKALVLSYISNGNLETWLHSHNRCLTIIQRLNIMIDVAAALDYLHYGCEIPIVHCDLKPNNILLDEDMVTHVTDFGISKLLNGGDSITRTMTGATIGYMAPEYGLEGIVSRQGDVYSYGILLIETFTQKKPTHEMFGGEFTIKHWVEESYPDAISDVIDPRLLTEDREQSSRTRNCLASIMGLALACSSESPNERTSMKDVLAALKKIKIKFLSEARN